MNIIALPDLHEKGIQQLPLIAAQLAAVDLVLLVGDMTNDNNGIAQVIDAVKHYNPNIRAVTGNWDNEDADQYLSALNINLTARHEVIDGITFIGAGGALSPGAGPRLYTEEQFAANLQKAAAGVDPTLPRILVTHQPPTGVLRIRALGSSAVREFIENTQPILCFCGHVHQARGIENIGSTQVINPGPLYHGHYAYVKVMNGQVTALEIRNIER
ncbi:MAG: metallophosphoesterase family protein [Anaerolineae bacterium]